MSDPQNSGSETPAAGPGNAPGNAGGSSAGQVSIPGESLVTTIVQKIQEESWLFLIAIVVLLVGLFLAPSSANSSNLRFIILVIAALTLAGLLIRALLTGYQAYLNQPRPATPSSAPVVPSPPPIHVNNSRGTYIGDDGTPTYNENSTSQQPATDGAPPVPPTTPQGPAPAPAVPSANPQEELAQQQLKLAALQQQLASYGSGTPSDTLVNDIAATQQAIQQLQSQLGEG